MSLISPIVLATSMLVSTDPGGSTDTSSTVTLDTAALMAQLDSMRIAQDSMLAHFEFQHGTIDLEGGVAAVNVPAGFKFLDKEQSERVIVDLWGNPSADGVLGMIFPEADDVLADSSYAFVIQYDEMGYVKDDDADDIDYDEMLKQMKEEEVEENRQRVAMGYGPAYIIGWAAKPFYDKERKILHWAKEIQFGDSAESNTLNYNVRILGRKGVLVLNAVADVHELPLVQQHIDDVLGIVQFKDGYKYEQFDSNVDEVAAWTLGGLVAGKVLVKAGLFAGLLKVIGPFFKWILIGLAAIGGWLVKVFVGRKKNAAPPAPPAIS
jgi:uncharacterized membrane-anchored protein